MGRYPGNVPNGLAIRVREEAGPRSAALCGGGAGVENRGVACVGFRWFMGGIPSQETERGVQGVGRHSPLRAPIHACRSSLIENQLGWRLPRKAWDQAGLTWERRGL